MPDENADASAVATPEAGAPAPAAEADPFNFDDPSVAAAQAAGDEDKGDSGGDGAPAAGEKEQGDSGAIADDLRSRAEGYGFSKEEIAAFGDNPAALEAALGGLDRKLADWGRKALEGQRGTAQPGAGQQQQAAQPAKPATPPEPFKLNLDPERYDEGLLKELSRLVAHVETRIGTVPDQFKGDLQRALEYVDGQRAQERDRTIDGLFDGLAKDKDLGENWTKLFGKTAMRSLREGSTEWLARVAVCQEMEALAAGNEALGRRVPPQDELFTRAVRILHPDVFGQQQRKQIANTLDKRKGQALGRPTGRKGGVATDSKQEAVKAVKDLLPRAMSGE